MPFAFALAALFWRGDLASGNDPWLRRALPWGLFSFAILGLAMMMGGYWAYEMLGWGGFWEWDPVENGPFVPWMGLLAFLHAAQIQRVRGGFWEADSAVRPASAVRCAVRDLPDPDRRPGQIQRPLVFYPGRGG